MLLIWHSNSSCLSIVHLILYLQVFSSLNSETYERRWRRNLAQVSLWEVCIKDVDMFLQMVKTWQKYFWKSLASKGIICSILVVFNLESLCDKKKTNCSQSLIVTCQSFALIDYWFECWSVGFKSTPSLCRIESLTLSQLPQHFIFLVLKQNRNYQENWLKIINGRIKHSQIERI